MSSRTAWVSFRMSFGPTWIPEKDPASRENKIKEGEGDGERRGGTETAIQSQREKNDLLKSRASPTGNKKAQNLHSWFFMRSRDCFKTVDRRKKQDYDMWEDSLVQHQKETTIKSLHLSCPRWNKACFQHTRLSLERWEVSTEKVNKRVAGQTEALELAERENQLSKIVPWSPCTHLHRHDGTQNSKNYLKM